MKNEVNPLITVYTPTYNRVGLLVERAITSVLSQTYKNFEYIIVGDGCTDTTEETVKSINDPRIRFFNIKRKRPHHNYDNERDWFLSATYPANFALKKAKGKWIARIDDDDIWNIDHLKKSLKFAQENNYEFISSQYEFTMYGKKQIYEGVYLKDYFKEGNSEVKIGGHSTFFYKGYLKKIKYNPKCYKKKWNRVDHADFSYRLYKKGILMGFLDEVLTYMYPRVNENTIGYETVKNKMELKKNAKF